MIAHGEDGSHERLARLCLLVDGVSWNILLMYQGRRLFAAALIESFSQLN